MTHDFILVPQQLADSAEQARAAFDEHTGQDGNPDVDSILAGLNGWNSVVSEAGKPELALAVRTAGPVVLASAPDAATAKAACDMMVQVSDGLGYTVFDVEANAPAGPAPARANVTVTIGGERELTSITAQELRDWIPRLDQLAATPFLIVGRPNTDGMTYIQTYQNSLTDYTLEVQNGAVDQHYATTLNDPEEVASLIWDWSCENFDAINKLPWERQEL